MTSTLPTYFLATDLRGSTRAVCASNGKPAAWLGYDPFGSRVALACGGDAHMIDRLTRRYTGQVFDAESQLYHYGARLYDDALARFVATDPDHQASSPYLYCGNDPVDHVDALGRVWTIVILYDDRYFLFDAQRRSVQHIPVPPRVGEQTELHEEVLVKIAAESGNKDLLAIAMAFKDKQPYGGRLQIQLTRRDVYRLVRAHLGQLAVPASSLKPAARHALNRAMRYNILNTLQGPIVTFLFEKQAQLRQQLPALSETEALQVAASVPWLELPKPDGVGIEKLSVLQAQAELEKGPPRLPQGRYASSAPQEDKRGPITFGAAVRFLEDLIAHYNKQLPPGQAHRKHPALSEQLAKWRKYVDDARAGGEPAFPKWDEGKWIEQQPSHPGPGDEGGTTL